MNKILIIEDDPSTRELYKHFFKRFKNVTIYEAENGSTGLDMAKNIKPGLIILDNKMPGMPGEMVAKQLKANPSTKEIPIILATAMKLSPQQVNMIKLDVDEFIHQPFSQWDLQHKAEKYLGPLVEVPIE